MTRQPIFIVSTGRAGSKMIANALAQHQNLFAIHEPLPHLLSEAYSVWADSSNMNNVIKSVISKRKKLIETVHNNGLIYVESAHYCAHLIPILYELFNAKFIYLHRDGRSFVRSGLDRKTWYPDNLFYMKHLNRLITDFFTIQLRRRYLINIGNAWDDHRLSPPQYMKDRLSKITWLWCEINNIILRDLSKLPSNQYMRIGLEQFDLSTLTQILDFINISQENLEGMKEIVDKKPNKTQRRTIPVFDEWSDKDKKTFWSIATQTMNKLNYK